MGGVLFYWPLPQVHYYGADLLNPFVWIVLMITLGLEL